MPRNTSTNSRLHRIPTHVVRTRSLKQRYYLVFAQLFPELTLHYWFSGPCTIGYKLPTIGLYRVKMTGSSRRTHCTCSWRRLVLYLLDSRRFSSFPGDARLLPGDLRGWNARGYCIHMHKNSNRCYVKTAYRLELKLGGCLLPLYISPYLALNTKSRTTKISWNVRYIYISDISLQLKQRDKQS